MENEADQLGFVDDQHPFVAILGGARLSAKLPLIRELIDRKVDKMLVGGALAYTFLKAQGFTVGKSLIERDMLGTAQVILGQVEAAGIDLHLPTDHQVVDSYEPIKGNKIIAKTIPIEFTNLGHVGMDIGAETITFFSNLVRGARRIFWCGAMGVVEETLFQLGTIRIAQAVMETTNDGAMIQVEGSTARWFLNHVNSQEVVQMLDPDKGE
jgi:3-phosphoglycerate kinase